MSNIRSDNKNAFTNTKDCEDDLAVFGLLPNAKARLHQLRDNKLFRIQQNEKKSSTNY